MSKIETPDGALHSTVVDGCVVHGGSPLTPEGREALSEVIAAVRDVLGRSSAPSPAAKDFANRVLTECDDAERNLREKT